MRDINIPQAMQIVVDDLGWFCGDDDRASGGASRSGMPRRHCYKDYEAVNKLGEALDQKIFCAFCLAEWDPDNRLRKFPTISKYGEDWDNAKYIDMEEVKRCVEVINNSPYIDFALHGVGHGYYGGGNIKADTSDYYIIKPDKVREMTPEGYIRGLLDSFFEIMEYHGIKKEVTGMVPPSGAYRINELSRILADYGIKYVSTPYRWMKCEGQDKPTDIAIENGIITIDRTPSDPSHWDSHSIDYAEVPEIESYCFGSHWPNWLHEDAERNEVVIQSAIKYFYRCAEHQENIISRDMKFSVTQTMFWKYAVVTESENGETVIDITNVPTHENMNKVFYVNSRFPITETKGCKISEYDRKKNFITYEVEPKGNIIVLK